MWGGTGPEGKDEDKGFETLSSKKTGQAAAATGGGFGALLGDDDEEVRDESSLSLGDGEKKGRDRIIFVSGR